MRYAAATWNFPDSGLDLFGLVETFVGYGFDGLSFVPQQLLSLDASQGRELVGLLRQQRLVATIHGHFGLVPEEVAALVELLGDRLQCFTFDAAMAWDSRGHVFDAARMARLLAEVAACSRGTELKFGVEDFPLDSQGLQFYRSELEPVLADDRFGMLIDLGHLNLRRHKEAYFGRLTAIQYILRAPLPIIEVHIHDNTGERDSHQALGEGNLALDDVIYGLHKAGFDGVSTVELVPAFHDSNSAVALPKVRESLELWRTTWEESAMECCGADEQ